MFLKSFDDSRKSFDSYNITDFSIADRWKDAKLYIEYISKNIEVFDQLSLKTQGNVGVQIGE